MLTTSLWPGHCPSNPGPLGGGGQHRAAREVWGESIERTTTIPRSLRVLLFRPRSQAAGPGIDQRRERPVQGEHGADCSGACADRLSRSIGRQSAAGRWRWQRALTCHLSPAVSSTLMDLAGAHPAATWSQVHSVNATSATSSSHLAHPDGRCSESADSGPPACVACGGAGADPGDAGPASPVVDESAPRPGDRPDQSSRRRLAVHLSFASPRTAVAGPFAGHQASARRSIGRSGYRQHLPGRLFELGGGVPQAEHAQARFPQEGEAAGRRQSPPVCRPPQRGQSQPQPHVPGKPLEGKRLRALPTWVGASSTASFPVLDIAPAGLEWAARVRPAWAERTQRMACGIGGAAVLPVRRGQVPQRSGGRRTCRLTVG